MTQIFALHSAYGLATAAAAIDGGLLDRDDDRVLVPFTSSRVPETSRGILADPALRSLRGRFDRVEDLDALLGAAHPSSWKPRDADLPVIARLLVRAWGLDEHRIELFVQSPQVAPARTLMSLFPGAPITIIGDGLMTYSPMRVKLAHPVAARIVRVVHADAVPGVAPLVGSPHAAVVPVPPALFASALAETAAAEEPLDSGPPTVLVLGQYLAALGLVSAEEEVAMQVEMIDRAAERSPQRIVFKPHPSAPPRFSDALRARSALHGVEFVEYWGSLPAELLAERLDVLAVVAGFSTALPTVRALQGRDIASAGTETVLARLTPFENSNRIPVTIVDALTRPDPRWTDPAALQELIDAVGYAMQPEIAAHLRPRAVALLAGMDAAERARYFTPERLRALRLPGAPAESAVERLLRPAGGVGRWEELRLTALGARRRAGRAWKAIRGR
ncbi:alpha-2,8-polysialyltransferase family protein [Streptomyces sp. AC495_CC817]|uniref:alpha-2,8-polysialyltransferase family protein n=1 Tax=Streptomyces sp. AC495_CC817 TaxID=2823900 RepID=UPI001C267401|nr:alpha-2,8-polysialyltransferase family protein [Streptomyces sp. AC495_CC817]